MSRQDDIARDVEAVKRAADSQGAGRGQGFPPVKGFGTDGFDMPGDCSCPDLATLDPACPEHAPAATCDTCRGVGGHVGGCPADDGSRVALTTDEIAHVNAPRALRDPVGLAAGLPENWGEGRHQVTAEVGDGEPGPLESALRAAEGWTGPGPQLYADPPPIPPAASPDEVTSLLDRARQVAPTSTGEHARAICEEAADLVNGDRNADYGDALDNFTETGALWAVVFGHPVSAEQVALCLDLVKTARLIHHLDHADSWVDKVGYSSLGGGIVKRRADLDN